MGGVTKLFTQNILWRVLYYVVNLLLTIVIAHHFEASSSGSIFYLINNCSFIVLLLSLSFEAAIVYFGSNRQISINKLFYTSLVLIVMSALLLIFCFWGGKSYFGNSIYFQQYSHVFFFVMGNIVANFMAGFYFAQKKFVLPNLVSITSCSILLFLLFITNEESWLSNERFISLYFLSFFVQGIILSLLLLKANKDFKNIDFVSKKELYIVYKYLSLVFLGNVLTFFCYRMDYWFVEYYCNTVELGNYIQVSKLAQSFFLLPGMLATVLFPMVSGGDQQKVRELIPLLTRTLFVLYTLVFLILILVGNWLFPFVFGNSFSLMYTCFLLYIPGIMSFSALYSLTSYYSGTNRVTINLKGCALAVGVALIGDFIFIPLYGINGAAFVSSFAYLIYFIFVFSIFKKENSLSVKDFFRLKKNDVTLFKQLFIKG